MKRKRMEEEDDTKIKVLEFFSGIGGMHYSLNDVLDEEAYRM